MAIVQFLVVLLLVNGNAVSVRFTDFGSFASSANFHPSVTCEDFSRLPNKEAYIRKIFQVQEKVSFEPICLSPDQFSQWIVSARQFRGPVLHSIPQNHSPKEEHVSSVKQEYVGRLVVRETGRMKYSSQPQASFYLELNAKRSEDLALEPGEKVPYNQMMKYINKRVKVITEYVLEFDGDSVENEQKVDSEEGMTVLPSRRFHRVVEILPILE